MSKSKTLDQCKTWGDFERYAETHGLEQKRSTGGHVIYGNEKGTIPFSSHGSGDLPKGIRHSLAKELLKLITFMILVLIVMLIWYYYV